MRFGITSKLFIAILATNIVTALAVGLGARAVFESGFESYLHEREDMRLTRLAKVLATAYDENQGWDFLRGNDSLWVQLNQSVRPQPGERGRGGPGSRGGHGPGAAGARGPGAAGARGPGAGGPRFDRPPPAVVLDNNGKAVVGPVDPAAELRRHPIESNGQTVGWLAAPVHHTVIDVVDERFRERQAWAGWSVALLATVLSAVVAGLLARGLLSPVKRLAGATRRLADGDYRTRVESTRSDELGALVDDFNRLGNALEKHESGRRNFMADVSHELRTPLAVLKGELEALEDGVRPFTPAMLQSLQAEVGTLSQLVADLHDLSLADVGGLAYRFENIDLGKSVAETLHAFQDRFAARSIAVEAELAPATIVRADETRLSRVVANLLENAARYTHEGARVAVALRREGNKALLVVEDSGPGVPADLLPRLFERFFRVESSRNREQGGSGLGLAICRSVVEAHGGSITALASGLGGLRVEVRIPLAERTA
ncbi:MAG TPA: ATP-binding protein [Usitatibacter sp.]|nr:ATP-binding protein [Usitatibacter sp.]